MGNNRNLSAKYRFLLTLCRLFKLQKVMELPPEKAKKLFAKAYKGVHVTMEVAPGMYYCYAVMPLVNDAKPAYRRMIEYIGNIASHSEDQQEQQKICLL